MEIVVAILIGVAAGWLGSLIYKGSGLGFIRNMVVGLFGSVLGYWLFGKLGISLGTGILSAILTGAIGAIIILFLLNLIIKKK